MTRRAGPAIGQQKGLFMDTTTIERVNTTFNLDFDIADHFGFAAVKDTYRRSLKAFKRDIRYLAEMTIVLNHRCWMRYEQGYKGLSKVYADLYYQLRDYVYEDGRFTRDELDFFWQVTD